MDYIVKYVMRYLDIWAEC